MREINFEGYSMAQKLKVLIEYQHLLIEQTKVRGKETLCRFDYSKAQSFFIFDSHKF